MSDLSFPTHDRRELVYLSERLGGQWTLCWSLRGIPHILIVFGALFPVLQIEGRPGLRSFPRNWIGQEDVGLAGLEISVDTSLGVSNTLKADARRNVRSVRHCWYAREMTDSEGGR